MSSPNGLLVAFNISTDSFRVTELLNGILLRQQVVSLVRLLLLLVMTYQRELFLGSDYCPGYGACSRAACSL